MVRAGTLTLEQTAVSNNTAGADGGGIVDEATLIIENNSAISGNSTSGDGGGIFTITAGTATINVSQSSITNNTAGVDGGGLDDFQLVSSDMLTIDDSVISGNEGLGNTYGGGLTLNGTTDITNGSVISDNTGRYGGGIYNTGELNITDSSVSGNTAPYGGGVDTFGTGTFTSITVTGNTGSGINNFGTLTIAGSTLKSNTASAVQNFGTLNVAESTFASNSGSRGAGLPTSAVGPLRSPAARCRQTRFRTSAAESSYRAGR